MSLQVHLVYFHMGSLRGPEKSSDLLPRNLFKKKESLMHLKPFIRKCMSVFWIWVQALRGIFLTHVLLPIASDHIT